MIEKVLKLLMDKKHREWESTHKGLVVVLEGLMDKLLRIRKQLKDLQEHGVDKSSKVLMSEKGV